MSSAVSAQPAILKNVGIEQRLGQEVPLDALFRDENGQPIRLASCLHDRPAILALVYYRCPMLCSMALNGLTRTLNGLSESAGEQFDVITVSFDPSESAELASAKKQAYLREYHRPRAADGWRFLTGPPGSIEKVCGSVGFHYGWDAESKTFSHASAIIVLTPSGKISRYFMGIEYDAPSVHQALVEAQSNRTGQLAEQVLFYCFRYDPATGRYGLIIQRALQLLAAGAVFMLLAFISINVIRERSGALSRWEKGRT